ncbi:AzlD family protein [Nitrincola alkalilacustris]|uniref:AzlD family protein n=1 Tax=Nitrincola alkalilacustris TaxID=1571224 RepID=UPI0030B86612
MLTIETTATGTLLLIVIMGLVTLLTRVGGVLVMSFVPINQRVEGFINGMSGSVLIAILVPMAWQGDTGARMALLVTCVMMFLIKKPLPAITAGIATAAAWRFFF